MRVFFTYKHNFDSRVKLFWCGHLSNTFLDSGQFIKHCWTKDENALDERNRLRWVFSRLLSAAGVNLFNFSTDFSSRLHAEAGPKTWRGGRHGCSRPLVCNLRQVRHQFGGQVHHHYGGQVHHHYPGQVRQEYRGQGSQDITEWVGKSRFHRDREQVLTKPDLKLPARLEVEILPTEVIF